MGKKWNIHPPREGECGIKTSDPVKEYKNAQLATSRKLANYLLVKQTSARSSSKVTELS